MLWKGLESCAADSITLVEDKHISKKQRAPPLPFIFPACTRTTLELRICVSKGRCTVYTQGMIICDPVQLRKLSACMLLQNFLVTLRATEGWSSSEMKSSERHQESKLSGSIELASSIRS